MKLRISRFSEEFMEKLDISLDDEKGNFAQLEAVNGVDFYTWLHARK